MRKLFQPVWPVLAAAIALALTAHPSSQTRARRADAISEAAVRAHMEFLAGDAMNGRGSGTDDEWRAAAYIGSQMRRWGIEPLGDDDGFVQRIPAGRTQAASTPMLSGEGFYFAHGSEILVQGAGDGSVTGPLFRFKEETPVPDGAFVLMPASGQASSAPGAAALLIPETSQIRNTWASAGSRLPSGALPDATRARLPARIVLSREAYERVTALMDGTSMTFAATLKPVYTWNAIGQLKGSDRRAASEVVLLSAHLDHLGVRGTGADTIYNGADDDASGTTAVLALAEALAYRERTDRTVMFVWFGSEEAGGVGARHFLDHPPVPLDTIIANIEFEMIGRPDSVVPPKTLWLTGYERSNLGPELARRGARIVADPHPEQRFFTRSDNIQLACRGVVAQTISSFGLHREYHTPADDLAHIDFAHMTEAIQSMLRPVLWLANSDFKPEWLPGQKPERGNPCR